MRNVLHNRPPAVEDRIRCTACNFPCDPRTRPSGGEFQHITLSAVVAGETAYYSGDGPQGCPFCGSPAWRSGASLGDMRGWPAKNGR